MSSFRNSRVESKEETEVPRLRNIPRMMKSHVQNVGTQQPGAYNMVDRPTGERPAWTQNQYQPRTSTQTPQFAPVIVNDAELVTEIVASGREDIQDNSNAMEVENAEEIVRASAVVENRLRCFSRKLRNGLVRRARRKRDGRLLAQHEELPMGEQIVEETTGTSENGNHSTYEEIQGKRRTTASLIDDDDEDSTEEEPTVDMSIRATNNRFGPIPEMKEFNEMHPHVQSVMEVFPDTDIRRVQQLLRQHSLSTTFITLAEESSAPPSDEVLPPDLKHTTTYAQANDENRAIIMSYLTEMFPQIPENQIVRVLMTHSTHKGVAILSGEGEELLPITSNAESLQENNSDFVDINRQNTLDECKPPPLKKQKSTKEKL
mmetsp:Transcript_9339/g.14397  ORF Transcript_9339/g.14397 Transcript_9339/m.14397 type:complete len:375 (+) Transcript_9339:120-1244(+)|eukprot:CAMPEP_0178916476 /NCGR_PEP_ID=MMETSP0786-20121207/12665_1 /TAXON_ID=186022 /ORGANISM="Thalassionema frauenfeldii, Strain CCMP 1798" /LENGTH=374 /DNA_ID=CAMNT_0020589825 /DNA_START=54 /DNA_END=1178 /DNA_ORIENTATION=-